MHGPMIERPAPLIYDTAIYWLVGAWYFEQTIGRTMMKYGQEREWALAQAKATLDHACAKKVGELGWRTYHAEEEERTDDLYYYLRRTIYECPGFSEVKLFRSPHPMHDLRIAPQGGSVRSLPLYRLHYRSEIGAAALDGTTLYVVVR